VRAQADARGRIKRASSSRRAASRSARLLAPARVMRQ